MKSLKRYNNIGLDILNNVVIIFARIRAIRHCWAENLHYQTFSLDGEIVFVGVTEIVNLGGVNIHKIVKRFYLNKTLLSSIGGYSPSQFEEGGMVGGLKPMDYADFEV
jgi:hypothetical protein